jgi:phosphoglycerol transferase MdoB-like AlkP superfamily enzyme
LLKLWHHFLINPYYLIIESRGPERMTGLIGLIFLLHFSLGPYTNFLIYQDHLVALQPLLESIFLLLFFIFSLATKSRTKIRILSAFFFLILINLSFTIRLFEWSLVKNFDQGFSKAFFTNFDSEAVKIAFIDYPHHIFVLIVVIASVNYMFAKYIVSSSYHIRIRNYSFGLLLGLIGFAAYFLNHNPESRFVNSLVDYYSSNSSESLVVSLNKTDLSLIKDNEVNLEIFSKEGLEASAVKKTNLILVYLESLNQDMTGVGPKNFFKNLTPNLDTFAQNNIFIENIYGADYFTLGGLIASMCGVYFESGSNSEMIQNQGKYMDLPCLGDVLRKAGYYQKYLGGANSNFSGKRSFLLNHGYNEVLGWQQWEKKYNHEYQRNSWGLQDTDLFKEAILAIEDLRKKDAPFNLTLLTLNFHSPGFKAADCPNFPGINGFPEEQRELINGLYCTDFAFGKFVNELETMGVLENTALIVTADHTTSQHSRLGLERNERLFAAAKIPTINTPTTIKKALSSHDLAPTILDWLGIKHNSKFVIGKSALSDHKHEKFPLSETWHFVNNQVHHYDKSLNDPKALTREEKQELSQLISKAVDSIRRVPRSVSERLEALKFKTNEYDMPFYTFNSRDNLLEFLSDTNISYPARDKVYSIELNKDGSYGRKSLLGNADVTVNRIVTKILAQSVGSVLIFHLPSSYLNQVSQSQINTLRDLGLLEQDADLSKSWSAIVLRENSRVSIQTVKVKDTWRVLSPSIIDGLISGARVAALDTFEKVNLSLLEQRQNILCGDNNLMKYRWLCEKVNISSEGGSNNSSVFSFENRSYLLKRGLNIVSLGQSGLGDINIWNFDTYNDPDASVNLLNVLRRMPANQIFFLVASDEASLKLAEEARKEIEFLGSKAIKDLQYRSSFFWIGTKGQTLVERVEPSGAVISF